MAGALAQTVPETTGGKPLPAEDRSSSGAVVLEKSPVPAWRDNAATVAPQRKGVTPVGGNASRVTRRAQTRADLAHRKDAEAAALRQRGAGSLIEK